MLRPCLVDSSLERLCDADLEGAHLEGANLPLAQLRYANLQGARLDHTYQEHTVLPGHEDEEQPEGSAG